MAAIIATAFCRWTPKVITLANVRADQDALLTSGIAQLARRARLIGLTDQDVAEWLLSLSARWLNAHGVSRHNVQLWVDREMVGQGHPKLTPLVAAASSANDFGGRR